MARLSQELMSPKADLDSLVSGYDASRESINVFETEWLAEVFANGVCGAPNLLGKAAMEYIRRRQE